MTRDRMDPIQEGRRNWIAHDAGPVDQVTAATALTRGRQIVTQRMDRVLAEYNLTFAQLEVLVALTNHTGQPGMGGLGSALGLHPTSVSRTLARLERTGYVERVTDEHDKRVTRMAVTPRGFVVVKTALTQLRDIRFGLDGWDTSTARRFVELARSGIEQTLLP